eukprot:6800766-Pyramimonas_sp.AAC.1
MVPRATGNGVSPGIHRRHRPEGDVFEPCYVLSQGADKDVSWRDRIQEVVMNTIGIRMIKPRDSRDAVPATVMHMKRMWEAALAAMHGDHVCESVALPSCALCRSGVVDRAQPSLSTVRTCCVCLMTWHPQCSDNLNAFFVGQIGRDMRPGVFRGLLPAFFERHDSTVCALCSSLLR